MISPVSSSLCLLTIHAHPDDGASKGSATVAKYAADGVRTVLVSATAGEAGEVLNRAMDKREVVANLLAIRHCEPHPRREWPVARGGGGYVWPDSGGLRCNP